MEIIAILNSRSIVKDINEIAEVDGYKDWRLNENEELSSLVQRRLHYLQNPKDCKTAKKLTCDLNKVITTPLINTVLVLYF